MYQKKEIKKSVNKKIDYMALGIEGDMQIELQGELIPKVNKFNNNFQG